MRYNDLKSSDIIVVKPAFELFEKTVGRVLAKSRGPFRWCDYVVRTECEEGLLLWSTLSGALILVKGGGWKVEGGDPSGNNSTLKALGFVVPVGFDEWKASEELRELCGALGKGEHREWGFTVFTTLACNARCPYCFEKGMADQVEEKHMSKSTAEAVADFIADRAWASCRDAIHRVSPEGASGSQGPTVRLSWFGGEPMMNVGAIETICGGLERRGVAWRSEMTTNGVLFDRALARHAVERWRLEGAQVTLDGREGEYNRVKGIRLSGGESAYGRVMRNIGWLAEAGVRVTVRLNLSLENAAELMLLAEELQPMEGLDVYARPLYEYYEPGHEAEAKQVFPRLLELHQRLAQRGLLLSGGLPKSMKLNSCQADSDTAFVVLPSGRLGRCEHYGEEMAVGDIHRGVTDPERMAYFRQQVKSEAQCRRCAMAPQCNLLECCRPVCTTMYRNVLRELIFRPMLAEYLRWRRGEGEGEENLFACV